MGFLHGKIILMNTCQVHVSGPDVLLHLQRGLSGRAVLQFILYYICWYRPAMYFYIRTEKPEKVMDVRGGSTKPGAKVIIYEDKGDMADNQLWYEDKNGVIRSKLNDYALDGSGGYMYIS